MTVRYRFRNWAREQVGSDRPAEVKRWFDARGVVREREFWRGLLKRKPKASFVLSTWGPICDAAGLPLSTFIEIEPSDTPTPVRPRPPHRKSKPAPVSRPQPPRPRDYFGVTNG